MSFAKDFVWGVATAAYQIEGGAYEGDKGLNGWDVGSRTPGRVFEGHSGDVGCDHFHHMKEDVALMQRMGVKNYRFSVNWARVMPHGTGEVSAAGAQFYIDLLKELRRAGSPVKVCALCPGPVDTEFNKVAGVRFSLGGLSAQRVAREAVDGLFAGKGIVVPGAAMKAMTLGRHFAPDCLLARITYHFQHKKGGA